MEGFCLDCNTQLLEQLKIISGSDPLEEDRYIKGSFLEKIPVSRNRAKPSKKIIPPTESQFRKKTRKQP
jgi:hypothetical protein